MNINRNVIIWIAIAGGLFLLINLFQTTGNNTSGAGSAIAYSHFIGQVETGQVAQVEMMDNEIKGLYKNGTQFKTYAPADPTLVQKLIDSGVLVSVTPPEKGVRLFVYSYPMVSNVTADWGVDFLHASDARWRW